MRLWIDNTGIQSAGVCLDGHGKTEFDVKGLLQFATFLVYGNRTLINGFEKNPISSKTLEFKEHFTHLGVPDDAIHIDNEITEKVYAKACIAAAEDAADNLEYEFNPREFEVLGGEPPDLPRGVLGRQVEFIDIANLNEGSEHLEEIKKSALTDKAVGACEYMLAANAHLRNQVVNYRRSFEQWNESCSYQLNIYLRYKLNSALARDHGTFYAPAVGRSQVMKDRSDFIVHTFNKALDDVLSDMREESLNIPSLYAYLLQKSKGEPRAVVKEALEVREKTAAIRAQLQNYAESFDKDDHKRRHEIELEIQALGEALREMVGLRDKATFRSALDFQLVWGVPAPTVSATKFLKWVDRRITYRNLAVFTEIATALKHYDYSDKHFNKLLDNCLSA